MGREGPENDRSQPVNAAAKIKLITGNPSRGATGEQVVVVEIVY